MGKLTETAPKFTREAVEIILGGVADGLTSYTDLAALAGIHPQTLKKWLLKGENGEYLFVQFYEDFNRERAMFKQEALRRIANAGKKRWEANAWLLERTDPVNFGQKVHEINHYAQVEVELAAALFNKRITIAELKALELPNVVVENAILLYQKQGGIQEDTMTVHTQDDKQTIVLLQEAITDDGNVIEQQVVTDPNNEPVVSQSSKTPTFDPSKFKPNTGSFDQIPFNEDSILK